MEQTAERIRFDFLPGLPIVIEPKATFMSSDTGILPLRQFDDQIGFSERFVACLHDPRDPALIDHGFDEMARQRIYGILAGYEDGNDHDALRSDPVFKLMGGRKPDDEPLAHPATGQRAHRPGGRRRSEVRRSPPARSVAGREDRGSWRRRLRRALDVRSL